MGNRTRLCALVALTMIVLIPVTTPAGAQTIPPLFHFVGSVKDPIDRPIIGASVTDGNKSVTTGADGTYRLGESDLGAYVLRASRVDTTTDTQSREILIPVDTTVNFPVKYRIVGALNQPFFSTRGAPASGILTVESFAPRPVGAGGGAQDSCVKVHDTRTGTAVLATYSGVTNPNGSFKWTYPLNLAEYTIEGRYSLVFWAETCTGGTPLTPLAASDYTVDNTPPTIAQTTWPLSRNANTIDFPSSQPQPLAAPIRDGLSGVDASSITMTVAEDTPGATVTSFSSVSFDATNGIARTTAVNDLLIVGKRYRATVAVADRAGNQATLVQPQGEGALVTNWVDLSSESTTTAWILPTRCEPTGTTDALGNREVSCKGAPLHLAATEVSLAGTRHGGVGTLQQEVKLESAKISYQVGGVALPPIPAGLTETIPMRTLFTAPGASETSTTYPVPQANAAIAELKAWIPPGATDPFIVMDPVTTSVVSPACPDPTTQRACSPDPIVGQSLHVWTPPALPHFAPCDAAVSHRERLVAVPGTDLEITAGVDSARLSLTNLTLAYALEGGASVRVTQPGTGASSYTFSIPGGSLPEGTRVSYRFEAEGTYPASDAACAGQHLAVAPSNLSYVSVATADTTRDNEELQDVLQDAFAAAKATPGWLDPRAALPSTEEVCAQFFAAPTPCALFPPVSSSLPDPPIDLSGLPSLEGASASSVCNQWVFRDGDSSYFDFRTSADSLEEGTGGNAWRFTDERPYYAHAQQTLFASQAFPGGTTRSGGAVSGGYGFWLANGDGNYHRYQVRLVYEVRGISKAKVQAVGIWVFGFWLADIGSEAEARASGDITPAEADGYGNVVVHLGYKQFLRGAQMDGDFGGNWEDNPEYLYADFTYPAKDLKRNDGHWWFAYLSASTRADLEPAAGVIEGYTEAKNDIGTYSQNYSVDVSSMTFSAVDGSYPLQCYPNLT